MDRRLALVSLLVAAGAFVKLAGAWMSGSRVLLVDSLTCIASLAGLAALIYYTRLSAAPPDVDHHYGHYGVRYGAVLVTIAAYMFAAGSSLTALLAGIKGYTVGFEAVPAALAGAILYSLAIPVARRSGLASSLYAGFVSSEVLESAVSIIGAYLGARLGYVYDLAGGFIILSYIFYETYLAHSHLLAMLSDRAPPGVREVFEHQCRLRGLHPLRVRVRVRGDGLCHGDALVFPEPGMDPLVADMLVDEVVEEMKKRGCDITVHIGYREASSGRREWRSERKKEGWGGR